jgi:hypothetical protein
VAVRGWCSTAPDFRLISDPKSSKPLSRRHRHHRLPKTADENRSACVILELRGSLHHCISHPLTAHRILDSFMLNSQSLIYYESVTPVRPGGWRLERRRLRASKRGWGVPGSAGSLDFHLMLCANPKSPKSVVILPAFSLFSHLKTC